MTDPNRERPSDDFTDEEVLDIVHELDDLHPTRFFCPECGTPLRRGEIDDGFCVECEP